MTPMTLKRRIRLCVTALIVLTCVPVAVHAQQDEAFKDGMKAYDDKKWSEVVKHMRAAIQRDPQESTRKVEYGGGVFRGGKRTDYLPHFYLGHALFSLQNCVAAIEEWSTSEKHGVVKAIQDANTIIQGGYSVCEGRDVMPPKTYDPASERARAQYLDVVTLAKNITTLGQQNPDHWADKREAYDKAYADLAAAQVRLNTALKNRSAKDFDECMALVERARAPLTRLEAALRSELDAARTAQGLALEVEQALNAAERDDRQIDIKTSGREPLAPNLAAMRAQARDGLIRGRTLFGMASKTPNPTQLTEAQTLAREASSKFRQVLDEIAKLGRGALEQQLSEVRTGATRAKRLLDQLLATIDKRMIANPALSAQIGTEYEIVKKEADPVRRRLDGAARSDNLAAIQRDIRTTAELHGRLMTKFGPFSLRERGVSQPLEEGTARFLNGQYREALDVLVPAANDPMLVHVHLFRAAALHAQYLRSPQTNAALLVQAREEVEKCKQIDSMFRPRPEVFSPRFITFFQGGSTGGG
jgi:hypothetical protein